jgi:hypothetical protein
MLSYWERIMKLKYRSMPDEATPEGQFDMYVQGLIDGVEAHAIHKDGQLLCGAMQTPFQQVRNEILAAARIVK